MAWVAYKNHNILLYPGGLLDQPIRFLVQFAVIDLVHDAYSKIRDNDFDWNKLDGEAIRMIRWLDND